MIVKVLKGRGMLFFSFLVMTICLSCVLSTIRRYNANERNSRNFYSELARNFNFMNMTDEGYWNRFFSETTDSGFVIYNIVPDSDYDIRGVAYKGDVKTIPIAEGSFFEEGLSEESRHTAVVGKEIVQALEDKNGEKYFTYDDQEYKVIGVAGMKKPSRLDKMVFLDFKSTLDITGIESEYVLDGKNAETISETANSIEYYAPEETVVHMALDDVKTGVAWLFEKERLTRTLYGVIFVSFFISTIMVVFLWIEKRRKRIGICRLLGTENRGIVSEILRDYLKITTLGYLAGIVCTLPLVYGLKLWDIQVSDMGVVYMLTVIFGLLALVVPLIKNMHVQVFEIMR